MIWTQHFVRPDDNTSLKSVRFNFSQLKLNDLSTYKLQRVWVQCRDWFLCDAGQCRHVKIHGRFQSIYTSGYGSRFNCPDVRVHNCDETKTKFDLANLVWWQIVCIRIRTQCTGHSGDLKRFSRSFTYVLWLRWRISNYEILFIIRIRSGYKNLLSHSFRSNL